MSLVKLECPICEFVLEADLQITTQARCTCCGHLFVPGKSTIRPITPQASQSRATETHATLPPALPEKNGPQVKEDSHKMVSRSDEIRSSIILQRGRARRRSNLIFLLLFVGTLLAGALVAKRFGELEEPAEQKVAELNQPFTDITEVTPVPNIVVETDLSNSPPQAPTKKDTKEPSTAPPLAPPKFAYLSSSVAKDQAAHLKPYIMLLEIESPSGTTYATGTIVDSRGYLLTSLPAVAGATKIKVSSARSRWQIKQQTAPPMSDTVRNVVAVSNSEQWALLEVNRRFVLNAADIQIPHTDRIVLSQPLLRVVAPRSSADYAVSEMRVGSRLMSSALAGEQKELLNISQSAEDSKNANWIIGPHSEYDQLGAALVSTNGELVGMLVSFDNEHAYYISTSDMGNLLEGNNFVKTPLSDLK